MKKLLAIVMIAGSLITSVFAQENGKEKLSTFNLSFPMLYSGTKTTNLIGIDYHDYSFSSGLFGYYMSGSISVPFSVFDPDTSGWAFLFDSAFGASFRVLDTDMMSLILGAGITFDFIYSMMMFIDVGVCADACLNFKFSEDTYLTGGVQFSYFPLGWAFTEGFPKTSKHTLIAPRIGITTRL